MDAPPDLEASLPFVQIGEWMKKSGIHVPEIFAKDLELGFMVLSDFGDFHFQDALASEEKDDLYNLAINEIVKLQSALSKPEEKLPAFDTSWQTKELEIFREWCLPDTSKSDYQKITESLTNSIDQIPKAFMHRDFHCRNLLFCTDRKLGVIDFQGAMFGPVTYDLVSLLRDCYVDNNMEWITRKVIQFQKSLQEAGLQYAQVEPDEFTRWFDFSGLQRHLKCVGIFHRLKIRDQKPDYMKDVPRVLEYIHQVLDRHPELEELKNMVQQATILE
jgi:aminoglycoside/choline kinase family phosphotransferase